MDIQWYRLHPMVVHFPIALLVTGLCFEAYALFKKGPDWLSLTAKWLLWIGTLSAIAAVGSGLLAEKTAPHVPPAWETLEEHETLGFWTLGIFAVLSAWRLFLKDRWRIWAFALWCVAAGLLVATGSHGGELVYEYGVGVGSVSQN